MSKREVASSTIERLKLERRPFEIRWSPSGWVFAVSVGAPDRGRWQSGAACGTPEQAIAAWAEVWV